MGWLPFVLSPQGEGLGLLRLPRWWGCAGFENVAARCRRPAPFLQGAAEGFGAFVFPPQGRGLVGQVLRAASRSQRESGGKIHLTGFISA